VLLVALCGVAVSFAGDSKQTSSSSAPNVPIGLQRNVKALGTRFTTGYERVTLAGSLTRNGEKATTLTAVYEPSRKMRLQGGDGKNVVYDGSAVKGSSSVSSSDEDLMESLFEDSPDGMLYLLPQARLFRPLMYRARLDDGKAAKYTGSYVDIYELILPVPTRAKTTARQKHFYFDSDTGLLMKVVYLDANSGNKVQTLFQNWKLVNGTMTPGLITRVENGTTKLSFTVSDASVGASSKDNSFIVP
jgi:hypothetical protein